MRETPARLDTLSELETASPPALRISAATSSAGPAEPASPPAAPPPRSFTTTFAPSRAASSAHSLPMPLAPPVTRTTLPSSTPMSTSVADCDPAKANTMAGTWHIRPYRPEDADAVAALDNDGFGPGRYAK